MLYIYNSEVDPERSQSQLKKKKPLGFGVSKVQATV